MADRAEGRRSVGVAELREGLTLAAAALETPAKLAAADTRLLIDVLRSLVERLKVDRDLTLTNEIVQFFHCRLCVEALPKNQSPQSWRRLDVGWTPLGFQVWCTRHDANVVTMDFEGMRHPGTWARKLAPGEKGNGQ